jgi:uncharacterized protein YggT (Ycf19 family)
MGVIATLTVLADAINKTETFVTVFITIYTIVLLAYVVMSWLRLPYSPWLNRIQRFLYDVAEPYLRLFRRVLPSMGALDLSPMIAIIALWLIEQVLIRILEQFH